MKLLLSLLLTLGVFGFASCSKVPAGNVGVKVYMLGGNKGVDHEVVGVGRYWIGINEELFIFPVNQQNYVWTKSKEEGNDVDESITFQTKEGMSVSADIGISYSINPEKVSLIFQKYRKGVEEITSIYLRNYVRDSFNMISSSMNVESVYGEGKAEMLKQVQEMVSKQVSPIGINIEKIYLVGELRLPKAVLNALNSKIEATQMAQKAENEVARSRAEAESKIAEARGEAESIRLKQSVITETLIRYETIKKWNGKLPTYMTGPVPFVNLK